MNKIISVIITLLLSFNIITAQNSDVYNFYISYDVNIKENAKDHSFQDYQKHTYYFPNRKQKIKLLSFFTDHIKKQKTLKSYTGSRANPPFNLSAADYSIIDNTLENEEAFSINNEFFFYDPPKNLTIKKGVIKVDNKVVYDTNKNLIDSLFSIYFFENWTIDPVKGTFVKTVKDIGLKLSDKELKTLFQLKTGEFNKPYYQETANNSFYYTEDHVLFDNIVYDVGFAFNTKLDENKKHNFEIINAENPNYYHYISPKKRNELIISLLNCTKSQHCNVYTNSSDITTQLSDSAIIEEFIERANFAIEDYETYEMTYHEVENHIYLDEIEGVRFHETWFYDPENFGIKKVVNGITLIRHTMDVEMYWPAKEPYLYIQLNNDIKKTDGTMLKNILNDLGNHQKVDKNINLVYKNGKYRLYNNSGSQITDDEYDYIDLNPVNEFIRVQNVLPDSLKTDASYDGMEYYEEGPEELISGYISKKGEIIIAPVYDNVDLIDNLYFIVTQKNKKALFNKNGDLLIDFKYDWIDPEIQNKNLIKVFNGSLKYNNKPNKGYYGLCDLTGKEVVQVEYKYIGDFAPGVILLTKKDNKTLINEQGELIRAYKHIGNFNHNRAVVLRDNLYGYIDSTGYEVISAKYQFAASFNEGKAKVYNGESYQFIDPNGNSLGPCQFDKHYKQNENLFIAKIGNYTDNYSMYGLVDSAGKAIAPFNYTYIERFKNGLAKFTQNRLYGYMDKSGKIVLDCEYKKAYPFSDNYLILFKNRNDYGIVDTGSILFYDIKARKLIETEYQSIGTLSRGLTYVVKNNKYGFINESLKEINMGNYDWMPRGYRSNLGYGFRIVYKGETDEIFSKGKFGAVDSTGTEKIPCKYNWIYDFDENKIARVFVGKVQQEGVPLEGKFNIIDINGNELINWEYNFIYEFYKGKAKVYKGKMNGEGYPINGKFGFIDPSGKVIIPLIYDDVNDVYQEKIQVQKNGETFYIDHKGNRLD